MHNSITPTHFVISVGPGDKEAIFAALDFITSDVECNDDLSLLLTKLQQVVDANVSIYESSPGSTKKKMRDEANKILKNGFRTIRTILLMSVHNEENTAEIYSAIMHVCEAIKFLECCNSLPNKHTFIGVANADNVVALKGNLATTKRYIN
jgi:hypothetical protein